MPQCPSCSERISVEGKFCPSCGAALEVDSPLREGDPLGETEFAEPKVSASPSSSSNFASGNHHGRFLPGTNIEGRYRIVSLLGKGGMGEVYRADDLKLGHTVALKFLPATLAKDSRRLEFFLNEVRLSRQISHPNVCRVYDVGEVDGHQYLSMEYVDGEDLKILLRRIGRFPEDRGVELSQQLCAGLAAAHDKGVLHRDLKPSNVMVDGRGQVRITDFGLAKLSSEDDGNEIVGTPAYMAPEQLENGSTSSASDIYSLGLILREIFTGKQVYESKSLHERRQQHQDSTATPSTGTSDLDPIIDRAIFRCLEVDPTRRPTSARNVAAALPGADPLAAALAAGETPSPQLVAASGDQHGLQPKTAVALLIAVLLMSITVIPMSEVTSTYGWSQMSLTPQELRGKARVMVRELGYDEDPLDEADGFFSDQEFAKYVAQEYDVERFQKDYESGNLHANGFWYRSSPQLLVAFGRANSFKIDPSDPPMDVPGMKAITLDTAGRLSMFRAIPKSSGAVSSQENSTESDEGAADESPSGDLIGGEDSEANDEMAIWKQTFALARLEWREPDSKPEVDWAPPDFADQTAYWSSVKSIDRDDLEVKVQAASLEGEPTFFRVIFPWNKRNSLSAERATEQFTLGTYMAVCLILTMLAVSALLAYRNLRLRRGDRRVALRLAGLVFCVNFFIRMITFDHAPSFEEIGIFLEGIADSMYDAVIVWAAYIAIEPYVRRIWPSLLVSWSRLQDGQLKNAHVGRDILVGIAGGLFAFLLGAASLACPYWFSYGPPSMLPVELSPDPWSYVVSLCLSVDTAIFIPLTVFLLFLLVLRALLRHEWLAIGVFWLFITAVVALNLGGTGNEFGTPESWIAMSIAQGILALVIVRFGLLPAVFFTFTRGLFFFPVTDDPSSWYFGYGIANVVIIMSLAGYGCYVSMGGRSLFNDELLNGTP